jgi:hypothetical protein
VNTKNKTDDNFQNRKLIDAIFTVARYSTKLGFTKVGREMGDELMYTGFFLSLYYIFLGNMYGTVGSFQVRKTTIIPRIHINVNEYCCYLLKLLLHFPHIVTYNTRKTIAEVHMHILTSIYILT